MKKLLTFLFYYSLSFYSNAQLSTVPYPAEVKISKDKSSFILSATTKIYLVHNPAALRRNAAYLRDYIFEAYGLKLKIIEAPGNFSKDNLISLTLTPFEKKPEDAYSLIVKNKNIAIASYTNKGIFYAVQTFKQLLPLKKPGNGASYYQLSIPLLSIIDYPRFPYRGMHLDVSRHFFSVAEVKKYIDHLAAYKFNNFHWHLTDDQGWRIEIKKYPLLTQTGSCRAQTLVGHYGSEKYDSEKYCGFYTQAQIRDVVAYAKACYINIIPEIEMPGHAVAALASYPFLGCTKGPYKTMETWGVSEDVFCAGNDSTYKFIEDVLDEVSALFPSSYIHIGGDECPKESWKKCLVCQQKIRAEGLKNEEALQSYFIKRIEKYLAAKGKKIIGWDEIAEGGLAPGAVIMSWRGEEGGKAAAISGHDAIMTPGDYCYFDHSQSANEDSVTFGGYVPLEKVYTYEPVPAGLSADEAKHILGAQGNVWTEYITNEKKLEYTIFPRMAALAEVLWSPKVNRDWKSFEQRLPGIFAGLKSCGIDYSNAYYDLSPAVIPLPGNKVGWKLETKIPNANIIYRKQNNPAETYNAPVEIKESGIYEAAVQGADGKMLSNWAKQEFSLNKATGKTIMLANPPSNSYAGSGGFTLVDGVENTKGMARSTEFLGFSGTDMEATIDLGAEAVVSELRLTAFSQEASWIYLPASVMASWSTDGEQYNQPVVFSADREAGNIAGNAVYKLKIQNIPTRYVRIRAENYGIIPPGEPGAGIKAWLFITEVKVF